MNDILHKTGADVLRWKATPRHLLMNILPSIEGIRRSFMASYELGEFYYNLYFIETRSKRVGDFGAISEVSIYEIYILNRASEVALILSDGLVERDDLLRLAGLIDAHNDQTREFFEAFDRSGAA